MATLRALLASPEIVQAPACHDSLSAALTQQAGFPMAFMSGTLPMHRMQFPSTATHSKDGDEHVTHFAFRE